MLQRHEHADASGRGVDRARKRDDQQQGKIVDDREGDAGRDHQAGAGEQQPLPIVA